MMNTPKSANAPKWMRTALLAALAAIVAAGCNNDEIEAVSNTPANKSGKMTIHVATGEKTAETRVAYDDNKVGTADGNALTRQASDQLTVVRMDYDRYRNHKSDYLYQGKDRDTSGNFEGTEITDWGNSWTVYYPHTVEIDTKDGTATLPMTGQIQAADGSTAHLRNYMLLAATDLTNLDDGFSLEMKSSIMKFDLENVPTQVGKLTSLMWMMETDTGSKCITLGFAQRAVDFGPRGSNSDGKLTAYIAFMPEEMSMKQPDAVITLMLIGEKTYTAVTTITGGKKYEAGKRYTINTNNKTMTWMPYPIMALTVKVEEGNLGFSIPFPTSGSTPVGVTVHWGDGSKNSVHKGIPLSKQDDFNHTYATPGTYTISIMSDQSDETPQLIQMSEFNFGNYRTANSNAAKLISSDTPLLTMPTTDLSLCFQNCTALQNIPLGLFDKNIEAANFNRCFSNCHALRSIPEGLFDKNTKATDFERCFYNCSRLTLNEKIFRNCFDFL